MDQTKNGNSQPKKKHSLYSIAMGSVLGAQFFSALADNAILIVAIAIVKTQGMEQQASWLQGSFLLPFILLAPFLGQAADAFPKNQVMLIGNLLKLFGAIIMWVGGNPWEAYGLVGVGAALYSPAKYGILSQMFEPEALVRANSMMEGSTIVAILAGILLGGFLADHSILLAFDGVAIAYAFAAGLNLWIPYCAAEKKGVRFTPWILVVQFGQSLRGMLKNKDSRFSLLGTSLFWGSGTTLRLMLFAWVPVVLLIKDNQTPADLMGAVSVGIVVGAAIAGIWISLKRVNLALLGGLLMGPVIGVMAFVHSESWALVWMVSMGIGGGIFVVPLNALLQERGHETIGAGNALAVQNFMENASMLIFVAGYSLLASRGVSITSTVLGFAILVTLLMGLLAFSRRPVPHG